jgi:hypothetical protein
MNPSPLPCATGGAAVRRVHRCRGRWRDGAAPKFEALPALPKSPTPGKPGDFAFLTGEWQIKNWWRRAADDWLEFDGESTVYSILGGICSIEELRIPARDFSGMGLRLLDVEKRVWSDHWVNAKSGVLTVPGQIGSFENGVGIFTSREQQDGRDAIYAGIWDQISANSCRWRQAASVDDGKTWEQSWVMHWARRRP